MNELECESCKRIFDNEKGLLIHYRKSALCSSAIMNRRTSQKKEEIPPTFSISQSSNTEPTNDDGSSNPMFPDHFYEEDDEQSDKQSDETSSQGGETESTPSDKQSDETSSRGGETESTTPCNLSNVLANPQDYENSTTGAKSTQFDGARVDQTPRNRYINYVTNEKGARTVTSTYRSDLELLYLLQKSNVPIGMYDEIQKWARKSYAINPKVFFCSNLTRKKALQSIEKIFNAKGCKPIPVICQLPSLKHQVTIQAYDFISAIYSLLTDPVLMREENLDLNVTGNKNKNPLYPFPKPAMYTARGKSFEYKEFSDGELYCVAYNTYCLGKQSQDTRYLHLPLIIIGQLDKTFVDSKGKLTLEPFKISLHIFKEQVRQHDFAWRPLGYICNQVNFSKYKNSTDKARDYHYMVHKILQSMKEYQKKYDFFYGT
jgi:hypothetical protein